MQMGVLFWVVFVIAVIFGAWSSWPFQRSSGVWLAAVILIALLGWRVFGPVIQ